jgi:hypothetical protein
MGRSMTSETVGGTQRTCVGQDRPVPVLRRLDHVVGSGWFMYSAAWFMWWTMAGSCAPRPGSRRGG